MDPADPGWTDDDTAVFLRYGHLFVPERPLQHRILTALLVAVQPSSIIELCCGDGTLSEGLLEALPGARITALDGSEGMRTRARHRLKRFGDRARVSAFELENLDWRPTLSGADAVVSSLAVHHLSGPDKAALYSDVYAGLRPGGLLAVADLIRPRLPGAWKIAAQEWDRSVQERAQSAQTPAAFQLFQQDGWNYFRDKNPDPIDQPSGLFEQLCWMREAGFRRVDVAWMCAGHAIFGGYREEGA